MVWDIPLLRLLRFDGGCKRVVAIIEMRFRVGLRLRMAGFLGVVVRWGCTVRAGRGVFVCA